MKKILLSLAAVCLAIYVGLVLLSHFRIKDRSHLLGITNICNDLRVEQYEVSAKTNLYSVYLTDTKNFREFIDTYHYYEYIRFECHGDSIVMKKFNTDEEQPKLEESRIYQLSALKKKHNYK